MLAENFDNKNMNRDTNGETAEERNCVEERICVDERNCAEERNCAQKSDTGEERERCPKCATTREEFYKTGLVGCEYCYTFFRDDVEKMVERIQAGTYYDTDKNLTPEEKAQYYKRRKVLNAEFAQAVRERDHSAAIDIREELKNVNKILLRGKKANDR